MTGAAELNADIAILGAGVGGIAAALAAARHGRTVILTEPTAWIGGQPTSQGVPPDEHASIEQYGCTASYRAYRDAVRAWYRANRPLTAAAMADGALNPGGCTVSRLCAEPAASLAVLDAMLAPYIAAGTVRLLTGTTPVAAETGGDRVTAVRVRGPAGDAVVTARLFLDATECGDLLPMAGCEHVVGAEARADTGEPHAAAAADPLNQQAITWCFAIEHVPGADFRGPAPDGYAAWRAYVPPLTPPWPGPLLSWTYSSPFTLGPVTAAFDPEGAGDAQAGFWRYRRLLAADRLQAGAGVRDICLVNWPQNDYLGGPIVGVDAEEAARHLAGSRSLSAALLHWLQTEAPRPDGGAGWPGLRPAAGALGSDDGFALAPYVREARRIVPELRVTELHVGKQARAEAGHDAAEPFADSVGIGSYRIDLHPSTSGRNYIDIPSLPFRIPLGALLPVRMENLLPAAKNIGTTHVTNGCYRLHPVEWNIGEAAGLLAVFCLERWLAPRAIRAAPGQLADYQALLGADGVELAWP